MGLILAGLSHPTLAGQFLLNASYDPTRELYTAYNKAFAAYWKKTTGDAIKIQQSHGGSGKQARAIMEGLGADIVSLALADDIDAISKKSHLLPKNWQARLPHNSTPYTSTIVFVVRKGNPKHIQDWDDLAKPGISVITPNPKISGGARWNYLAAWGYALKHWNNNPKKAQSFVASLYKNAPILDSGARGSAMTFAQNNLGDVLIAWENEAYRILKDLGPGNYQIVVPSISILAEPPVALIDKNVDRHGTRQIAEAYLRHLYSEEGQLIAAKNFYRPLSKTAAKTLAFSLQKPALFTIQDVFGGWPKAHAIHFSENGIFDQIYQNK